MYSLDEASKCHVDALQHDKADVPILVGLYAKLCRMRMLSSDAVVASAERISGKILDTYMELDKNFVELRDMVNNGTINLLHDFSTACRQEFEHLHDEHFWRWFARTAPILCVCSRNLPWLVTRA